MVVLIIVVGENGAGDSLIGVEALAHSFLFVVLTGDQRRSIVVADTFFQGPLVQQIVDAPAGRAFAAGGHTADQCVIRHIQVEQNRGRKTAFGKQAIQKFGLLDGAGVTVQEKAIAAVIGL